jgi:large subunit ribosomal protein L31
MKEGMHPEYYPQAQVICGCGNTFTTGATKQVIKTDICSACHPFFTGEQRIVDTAGQVERFMRRLEKKEKRAKEAKAGGD